MVSRIPVVRRRDGYHLRDDLMPETESEARGVCLLEWPAGFHFGTATSAYQVEGGISDTNWNRWEAMRVRSDGKETIRGGVGAGRATDMWNLFESVDLPLIKRLGLTMFRFSIEWSRIEPRQGEFDDDALERYARWCRLLRAEGIEPMVTLLHFTEPGWFVDLGGWEDGASVEAFGAFARYVVPRLAPFCAYWCTLNEPVGCAVNGWLQGIHPPGRTGEVRAIFTVLFHMLLGHKHAADAVAAAARAAAARTAAAAAAGPASDAPDGPAATPLPPPTVLIANNVIWFEAHPSSWWNPVMHLIAWGANMIFNFAVMSALVTGALPQLPLPLDSCAWLMGVRPALRSLRGSVNVCGVNNYVRVWFRVNWGALLSPLTGRTYARTKSGGRGTGGGGTGGTGGGGEAQHRVDDDEAADVISGEQAVGGGVLQGDPHDPLFEMSDMGWDLTPSSLGIVIDQFWRRYRLPILVTESGIADGDEHDHRRVRYLSGCLRAVHDALARGVDVRGYTYWSMLDNFEWAEGYRPRFGLCRVDYDTLERTPTRGFELYQEVIKRHRQRAAATRGV